MSPPRIEMVSADAATRIRRNPDVRERRKAEMSTSSMMAPGLCPNMISSFEGASAN